MCYQNKILLELLFTYFVFFFKNSSFTFEIGFKLVFAIVCFDFFVFVYFGNPYLCSFYVHGVS